MRGEGLGLQLWMELDPDVPGMFGQLHDFRQFAVGRQAGEAQPGIYGAVEISERHRHRYEVNINYRSQLEDAGLRFSGLSPDGELPEIVELPEHPWYIGVQFHPELKSKPFAPHPLFTSFIEAAVAQSRLM